MDADARSGDADRSEEPPLIYGVLKKEILFFSQIV
jgi:hypothetical protein